METLRFYSADDFGLAVALMARNGYHSNCWAELDQNNNIIYILSFIKPNIPGVTVQEEPEKQRQVLNEDGSQE